MSSKKRNIQRKQVKNNNTQNTQIKKNNSKTIFTKNKKNKNIKIFAGCAAVLLAGGIALTSCSGCQNKDKTPSSSSVDNNTNNTNTSKTTTSNTITSTTTTKPIVKDENEIIETTESGEVESNETKETEDSEIIDFEDIEPVYIEMSAEDVVTLSRTFSEYVNKTATLSHENYKFDKVTPEDLYSVVYLANIDSISKEETSRLIDAGLISDNIQTNVVNSFNFYELYSDDTINKIMEEKTNIIDLSLILANKHDQAVAETMNKIIIDSIDANTAENYKNYMDTVFYYAEDVTLSGNNYDYSKSIYETDRDELSVGADYTLGYTAICINEISKMNGVSNQYASEILSNGANDFSNVVGIFNGCKISTEIEDNKTLVK